MNKNGRQTRQAEFVCHFFMAINSMAEEKFQKLKSSKTVGRENYFPSNYSSMIHYKILKILKLN